MIDTKKLLDILSKLFIRKKLKEYWVCFKIAWHLTMKEVSENQRKWFRRHNTIHNNSKFLRK